MHIFFNAKIICILVASGYQQCTCHFLCMWRCKLFYCYFEYGEGVRFVGISCLYASQYFLTTDTCTYMYIHQLFCLTDILYSVVCLDVRLLLQILQLQISLYHKLNDIAIANTIILHYVGIKLIHIKPALFYTTTRKKHCLTIIQGNCQMRHGWLTKWEIFLLEYLLFSRS